MEYEFCHSGIKGMKWGIRRYQNPDGSLTVAGRAHYGVGGGRGKTESINKANRVKIRQEKRDARIESRKVNKELSQKKDQEQQELRRYEELRRTPAKRLSENEIKELTARLQMVTRIFLSRRKIRSFLMGKNLLSIFFKVRVRPLSQD